MNVPEKPNTLDDSRNQPRSILQHVHYCHSTDGDVMSVSTATPDRPYSAMLRLENYLCSTITTERMSGLALMHVQKDTEMDAERIIHQFSHKKDRRTALLFGP